MSVSWVIFDYNQLFKPAYFEKKNANIAIVLLFIVIATEATCSYNLQTLNV